MQRLWKRNLGYLAQCMISPIDNMDSRTLGGALYRLFPFLLPKKSSTPPSVIATNAIVGEEKFAINRKVYAIFNKEVRLKSDSALEIFSGEAKISGKVSVEKNTIKFTPDSLFPKDVKLTAVIYKNGVVDSDSDSNSMESDFSFSFATGSQSDLTPPLVSSISPLKGASSVGTNTEIVIEFTETMDVATLTSENLELYEGTQKIPVTVSYAGNIIMLKPSRTLAASSNYVINVKKAVQDSAGNSMSADFTSTFSTGGGLDSTSPMVSAVFPANGASNIPTVQRGILLIFSEVLDPLSVTKNSIQIQNSKSEIIYGSYNRLSNSIVFYPTTDLERSVAYTVRVNKEIKDLAGNSLEQDSTFTFSTAPYFATDFPSLITFSPSSISSNLTDGQTGVNPATTIRFTFPEAIDPNSVNESYITLADNLGNLIVGTFSFRNNNLSVILDPSVDLLSNTIYTVSVLDGFKTLSGKRLSSVFILSFTTGAVSVPQYTIGGTISGLAGSVSIQNNATDTLIRTVNGNFTFTTSLNSGSSYSVSVLTQPSEQTCNVSNGSGTLNSNVTNVAVNCIYNVSINPPTSLTYSGSPYIFSNGVPIVPIIPTVTGDVTTCVVNPSLPPGLHLNSVTCALSGTPTTNQSASTYTVTASNTAGSTTANLNITVNSQAPSSLIYSASPFTFTNGVTLTPINPAYTGTVTNCVASPSLPTGLSLNTTTCAISGTPTVNQVATAYTITASNSGGNATANISITINFAAPSALNYVGSPYTFTNGAPITITPTFTGTVTNCVASPSLPTGLSLNTTTCVLSGTPTVNQAATAYTITASNNGGNTTAGINIRINFAAPTALNYSGSPYTFTNGATISTVTPTFTGTVTSCAASPSLPTGLAINATTCAISGTPTVNQGATGYVITASNNGGSTTANIIITINSAPPSALSYTGSPFTFTQNAAITPRTATYTGTVTSCTSSPSLPAGLGINATNCTISGTPTVIQGSTAYTITASNSGGSTSVVINITVTFAAPSALTYSGSPYTFTQNLAISTQTPLFSGTVTSCTASPALPTGLGINATTCAISGTPTVTQAATNHTITASNANGNTTAVINITVNLTPPSALTYTGSPYTFLNAATITTITPSVIGTVTNCVASPPLPTGLGINATTCAISGTPTVNQTITNHIITASNNGGSTTASIHITVRGIIQEAYLKASNAEAGDNFGQSVAISGDTIVAGAHLEDSSQTTITNGTSASLDNTKTDSGAVYVFKRAGTIWAQEAYLKTPNADTEDKFGQSVSISGDTIAVGAYWEDSNQTTITNGTSGSIDNSMTSTGAAYVFKRSGTAWVQEAYLKAPNAGELDQFGYSVSVSGDTIIVGANREQSNETTITNGTIASADDTHSNGSGAVYVFKRTGSTWVQEAYIKASNSGNVDLFGWTLSISGDTIVVGSNGEDSNQTTITNGTSSSLDNSINETGAAYVYKRSGTIWEQEAYLKAPFTYNGLNFAWSVSISGDTIVVGTNQERSNQTTITNGTTASTDMSASSSGAAYVFKRTGGIWAQEAYLKAPNAQASDSFGGVGQGVSISNDRILVGAAGEDSSQTTITNGTTASGDNSAASSGAAYVFKRTGTIWVHEAYLKASNAGASDIFGRSVAVSGDTIVVGVPDEDSNQTTITNGTTSSADNSPPVQVRCMCIGCTRF